MSHFKASERATNTHNLIGRAIRELRLPENFHKPTYSFAAGDPTLCPDFQPHPALTEAVKRQLDTNLGNGYTPSEGKLDVRQFMAQMYSTDYHQLTADDVILDIGGCGTIHTILNACLNPGDVVLAPRPGFPLFWTYSSMIGFEIKTYNLDQEKDWEIDMASLEAATDERTKMVIIINPSNPTGTVWRREHQEEIVEYAKRHNVILFSDEVYQGMSFGRPHISFKDLCQDVPTILISSISKRFLVPGWRMGWIVLYDTQQKLQEIRTAIRNIKNLLLHPVPFIQSALPDIFTQVPQSWHEELMNKIKIRAEIVQDKIAQIPNLSMKMPQGALYCMVEIDFNGLSIQSSEEFCQRLCNEQGILVLPAETFLWNNGFRIVLTCTEEALRECMNRIEEFVNSLKV